MISDEVTSPAVRPDRRQAERHRPAFGTVCRIRGQSTGVGLVCDLSRTGVGMLLADPPAVGEVVDAALAAEAGGRGVAVTFRVVRVTPSGTGDYVLGAAFDTPLGEDELRPFVTPPLAPADLTRADGGEGSTGVVAGCHQA